MKVRNDDKETFIGEFCHIKYEIEPNKVVEIPLGAWVAWHGNTEETKKRARNLMGGTIPTLVPVDGNKKNKKNNGGLKWQQ